MSSQYLEELLDDDDIDLIAEPSLQDVLNELNKYPKVRDSNYKGVPIDPSSLQVFEPFTQLFDEQKSKLEIILEGNTSMISKQTRFRLKPV
jgi:hypothetical protein